jgi:two-component system alkaline phosphatase synthesis response regulator PhoP
MSQPFVLVIEDDTTLGATLIEILEFLDLSPELIPNGVLAIDRLAIVTPALILLDVHLSGSSGIDILADIRADERFNATKVIVMTADLFVDMTDLHAADAVILKPFTIDALAAAIKQVMQAARAVPGMPLQRLASGF